MKSASILTVAAVLAALLLAFYIQHQRLTIVTARAELATEQRDSARTELAAALDVITQLREMESEKERQRAELAAVQQQLEHALDQRLATIRRLQRENEDLRQWADQPLPEPIARLRERPALTGAAAYQQYLRDTGALPPIGEQPRD